MFKYYNICFKWRKLQTVKLYINKLLCIIENNDLLGKFTVPDAGPYFPVKTTKSPKPESPTSYSTCLAEKQGCF